MQVKTGNGNGSSASSPFGSGDWIAHIKRRPETYWIPAMILLMMSFNYIREGKEQHHAKRTGQEGRQKGGEEST